MAMVTAMAMVMATLPPRTDLSYGRGASISDVGGSTVRWRNCHKLQRFQNAHWSLQKGAGDQHANSLQRVSEPYPAL